MLTKFISLENNKLIDRILPRLVEATTFKIVQACTLAIPDRVGSNFEWWRHPSISSIASREYWLGRLALECSFSNQLIGLTEFSKRRYTLRFFKQREL